MQNPFAARDELISKQKDEIELLKKRLKNQQEMMMANGTASSNVSDAATANNLGPLAVIPSNNDQVPKIVIKVEKGGYCINYNTNN